MIDTLSIDIINWLRAYPDVSVSFLTYIFCTFFVLFINRYFKYIGLCCYIILCGIIANIQILYPVKYELLPFVVLLGTVVYSSTFFATDLMNKNYGQKTAKQAIRLALVCNLFFICNMLLMLGHRPLKNIGMDSSINALSIIFVPQVRFIVASYVSFYIAQLSELLLLKLWGESIISHNIILFISSILVDNLVFTCTAFVLFGDKSFSTQLALEISLSAVAVRLCCNLLNSLVYKFVIRN